MKREKDLAKLREGDPTKVQRDRKYGDLRDYSLQHIVRVRWDLNNEAITDKMFALKVDDTEVILDAEEVMRFLRWV